MSDITKISKKLGINDNVCLRVVDPKTKKIVQQYIGHNAATSTILTGIVHFLAGDGILNQAKFTLKDFILQYMSLGTMGLCSQDSSENGLPVGIGNINNPSTDTEKANAVKYYMNHLPGFGADGYSSAYNNNREYFGLGEPVVLEDSDGEVKYTPQILPSVIDRELISKSFPRVPITYRNIIPETDTESPKSMDLVLGGMVSIDALSSFMGNNDYIFITEAGLWNNKYNNGNSVNNGMLAGYRIFPQSINNTNLDSDPDSLIAGEYENIQKSILRVNKGQVVQIIWKIQLGSIEDIDIQRYVKYYQGPYWNVDPLTTIPVEVIN